MVELKIAVADTDIGWDGSTHQDASKFLAVLLSGLVSADDIFKTLFTGTKKISLRCSTAGCPEVSSVKLHYFAKELSTSNQSISLGGGHSTVLPIQIAQQQASVTVQGLLDGDRPVEQSYW